MRAPWSRAGRRTAALALMASVAAAPAARPEPPATGSGSPTVMAGSLDAFEQLLASQDSATSALTQWCRARGLATDPVITAGRIIGRRVSGRGGARSAWPRAMLEIGAREPLSFRHVALGCGGLVLSEARNWYVPARLPPILRRELASGTRPFGTVIAPLGFRRERLDSVRGASAGCPASTVLTNRALIRLADGRPLAVVVECYQPAVLG